MVEPGERVLVLGPSGSGKSTLLAAVAGLLHQGDSAGTLTVDGEAPEDMRRHVGLVLQDPEAQVVMARAGDDVAFGLENRGVPRREIWPRVEEALRTVGFPYGPQRPTSALSGGEKQRLALAGVLALQPRLLLLDEPTAHLDPDGAALVRDALRRVLDATGATLLLVEHRVAQVVDLVDRVVVLAPQRGVVADGRPEDVFAERGTQLADSGVWVPGWRSPARHAAHAPGAEQLSLHEPQARLGAVPRPVEPPALALRAGTATAVTGPNGAGKTTLALLSGGLLPPSHGSVRRPGEARPLHRWPARELVTAVGTVFQNPEHQFLTASVADEVRLGPRRVGCTDTQVEAVTAELLDRLHLAPLAAANPFTLSGGEKRRLSVATALATRPPVLVLDEPTFGQDARTWRELLAMLADLRDDGVALLAVTHDVEFAAALADATVTLTC